MSLADALAVIHRFLVDLRDTGANGFEGLVAALMDAATGQRFRLSGSGRQEGQDLRSEPGMGNRTKVEAKHYGKSKLSLRELEGELAQASFAESGMDLWILAASCRVDDEHAKKLEADACQLHVEVLFLDMGNEGLPRLAALMAAFPQALETWLDLHSIASPRAPLRTALNLVRIDPQFGRVLEQITGKLKSTLLGFDDARERAKRRLLSVMADRGNSVAHFNQNVALRAPEARIVDRHGIKGQFRAWWNSGSPKSSHVVALGEAGMGKTWVAMSWLLGLAEADEAPLFVPFNASVAPIGEHDSLEIFLPKLLAEWTQLGDIESWTGRLRRWFALRCAKPIVVLLADGLNERPNIDWPTFFRTLDDSRWRRSVCVVATDRPGHWHPDCAMSGLVGFQEIKIDGYTDSELCQALEGTGVELARIPESLQALIRKPHYCQLVIQHFDEMEREGDMSVERLIFLDNRHRFEQKRGFPLNSAEFVDLIKDLAVKYRQQSQLTRRNIEELLPQRDRDGRIYQEIIDGGLLVPHGNASTTFGVEPTRLVYGLGMLLAEDIGAAAAKATLQDLQERIAGWFEPNPEMDLKAKICGSAVFHTLIDDWYPALARRELLRYWLGQRNWADEWETSSLQCIVRCPQHFVDIAEDYWRSANDHSAAQHLLGIAFTKYRDDPRVEGVLIPAVERWMSMVNVAGHPLMRHDEARALKLRQEVASRLGREFTPNTAVTVADHPLLLVDDDGLSRLPRLGLLIISAGERAPYARALARWAVASVVLGGAMEYAEVGWVCRLTEDDLETHLIAEASRLLDLSTETARKAAHTLLECLGTAAANAMQRASPLPESDNARRLREMREADPCKSWGPWTEEECLRCMERTDIRPGALVKKLELRVMDAAYPVAQVLVDRGRELLEALKPETLHSHMSRTVEEHNLEEVWPLLATRAPTALADYLRRVVETLPDRTELGQRQLAFWLGEFSFLLRKEDVEVVGRTIAALNTKLNSSAQEQSEAQIIEEFLFLALLPHLTTEERLAALLARPATAQDLLDLQQWFGPLSQKAFQDALAMLRSTSDPRLVFRTLWFLAASPVTLSDADRDLLMSFMASEDPLVRGACMRFACFVRDETLGRRIVDLGHSYATAAPSWDTRWANGVVCLFSSHLPFETAAARLHPSIAGFLLENRGNKPDEVDLYAQTLHHGWQRIVSATDPRLAGLPVVVAKKRQSRLEVDLPEFVEDERQRISFANWTTTWTSGRPPEQSIADLFAALNEDPAPRLNQRARERVEALTAAWNTPALDWFGRDFSRSALRAIHERSPELVERWIEPALSETRNGRTVRLRLGSLLVDACAVLLERDPARGLRLWQALQREESVPFQFNTAEEAFEAPDSTEANVARDQELAQCSDDLEVSHVARLAEREGRREWLHGAVRQLIGAPELWRRAKGLMLASFSHLTTAEFEDLARRANVADTWVEACLKTMRDNVRANQLAHGWYRTYLTERDPDKAWGAYQVMLECGDERFYTWRQEIEREPGVDVERKVRFVTASWQSTQRALDRKDKRKDHLFGLKTPRGQVFPFVSF
jgi:hypothetical protein